MTTAVGQVFLDDGQTGAASLFANPSRVIVAREPVEVPAALSALQAALASGHHLAGYLSYELGMVLEPSLRHLLPAERALPLLWFAQFDAPPLDLDRAHAEALWPRERVYTTPPTFEWNRAAYRERFESVMASIRAGDVYEANLSMRAHFKLTGDPRALYARLRERAKAPCGAFVDDGQRQLLSLSPELFFTLDTNGTITVRPMKGTAPRDANRARDQALREGLRNSAKNRAENLMIVDLLRNDLGRIARTGSVEVQNLFAVEAYPTVYQMTSTIRAKTLPGCRIDQVLEALFPSGSVTGAPKIRAMQVIRAIEDSPRGVYCGAIGAFAPDGSARFNVAIRTITLTGREGELGVGGAIVADSTPDLEYDECLLKARYLEDARHKLALLETMRYAQHAWPRRRRHLQRMQDSAAALGMPFNLPAAAAALDAAVATGGGSARRVRLALHDDGTQQVTTSDVPSHVEPLRFLIAPECVRSSDPLNHHKTDWRDACQQALAWARARGADEAILLNERGEVSEGTWTNVFIERNGRLLTPPVASGALPGCLRAELLERGDCKEAVLTLMDLQQAERIYLGNSLRGLLRAALHVTR